MAALVYPFPRLSTPTRKPGTPALMPIPRFPKFRRTPGNSFMERWKRRAISGLIIAGNERQGAHGRRSIHLRYGKDSGTGAAMVGSKPALRLGRQQYQRHAGRIALGN